MVSPVHGWVAHPLAIKKLIRSGEVREADTCRCSPETARPRAQRVADSPVAVMRVADTGG